MTYIPRYTPIFLLGLLACLLFPSGSFAQQLRIANYPPKAYDGAPQVWCAVQDSLGLLYFGGTGEDGILQYDGETWRHIEVDNRATVFSLAIGPGGTIYVGGKGDVGRLRLDEAGSLRFESLMPKLASEAPEFASVWTTVVLGQKVYFHSYGAIFEYDAASDRMKSIPLPANKGFFSSIFPHQNTLYAQVRDNSAYRLQADTLAPFRLPDALRKSRIRPYHEQSDGSTILVPMTDGPMRWHPDGKVTVYPIDTAFVKGTSYFTFDTLQQGLWALGTRAFGVLLMRPDGDKVAVLDPSTGILDHKIYSVLADRDNNLWITTSNGISKLDGDADLMRWGSEQGLKGITTHALSLPGGFYVSTFQHLYWVPDGQPAQLVEGTPEGQHWGVHRLEHEWGTQLLAGLHNGLYRLEGTKATPLATGGHATYFIRSRAMPNRYYFTSSNTLKSIDYNKRNFRDFEVREYKNVFADFSSLAEDGEGKLWVGTSNDGVMRVGFEGDSAVVAKYGPDQGLPAAQQLSVFWAEGRILVGSNEGLHAYMPEKDAFVPFCDWGEQFCNGRQQVFALEPDGKGGYWIAPEITKKGDVGHLIPLPGGGWRWEALPLKRLPSNTLTTLCMDSQGRVWLPTSEGLFRHDPALARPETYNKPFPTLIRKVVAGEDSLIYGGGRGAAVQGLRGIAYAYNALHFEFASPSFDAEEQTVYSHRLTGFEDHWSEWSALPFKEYTNLREGDYVFEVKARNAYGYESLPASYRFSVAPPWYRTWPMYLGYAATALLLVWALVRWNTRRLEEDKLRLERTVEERTAEIRQQKEEITAQAENLRQMNEEIRAQAESLIEANEHIQLQKEQVEKSFQDVRVLSEIGQQLTKELDVEALIRQVYAQVNALMPAPAFGVGVYEPAYNRLAFPGFIENGEPLPLAYDSLKERNKLSIRCFQHKQEIIIGDADVEIDKILGIVASEVPVLGRRPASILYLPLVVEGEAVGVITVQSFERQAYSEKDVSLLRSLASYVAIALDNARAYAQVQETNRRITDSIRYAKTIQSAMLPPASVLRQSLGEHFIFFQPKDLVSGDFYWMAEAGGYTFAAVVDCTGHGVPGGFMSLIGHNLLHDLVMAKGLRSTTAIMEGMDAGVRQVLHQDESLNDDGMDVCLCRLERLPDGRVALEYCGVRRPLYWFRQEGGVLETVKGNHKGIGGKVYDNLRFEAQERLLAPGDALYLTTDGMGDLHNPDNEKFTSGRLMDWLLEHAPLPMEQQRLALEGHYRDFKKQAEQRDDIAVMGIRIEKR